MAHSIQLPIAALALIFLVGLWLLVFEIYPRYSAELLRCRLRAIRDDLFDLGRCGSIPFTAPEYRQLRAALSIVIDRAQDLGLARLVLCGRGRLLAGNESAPNNAAGVLNGVQSRFERCVANHVVRSNPLVALMMLIPGQRRRIFALVSPPSIALALGRSLCH